MEIEIEASHKADDLITNLLEITGIDYSAHRHQLAKEIWYEGFWDGNNDITVEFEDGLRSIRCIQEDEYDQHMDEDEDKPDWDKMLTSRPEYTWFADDTK